MWSMPVLAWGGGRQRVEAAALVSCRTTVLLLTHAVKNRFSPAVRLPNRLPTSRGFLNPPSSSPTQWMGNQHTDPPVEDSLLKG